MANVYIGGRSLKNKNDRAAILIGSKAKKLLPSKYTKLSRDGYQWAVVHITCGKNSDSVGLAEDCIPDIVIRGTDGKKFNNETTVYYIDKLDAYNTGYGNDTHRYKQYDLIFQIPTGISKFQLVFGLQSATTYKFNYTGQKYTSLITSY